MSALLVDQFGAPFPTEEERLSEACPRCNADAGKRRTYEMLGGFWMVACECGLTLARGRGVPPLAGDL